MAYNILLIDDSSIVRKSVRKALGIAAVEVGEIFEAENGKAGLDLLQQHWIDVVFLDINMPVMNGVEFMQQLHSSETLRDTAVVVVSTEGSKVRAEELQRLGIRAQLRKPVRPETLTEVLTNVLSGGRGESVS